MVTVIKPSMVTYAFDSLISKLSGKSAPNVPEDFPKEDYPLFVTWKFTANGNLRGCIGCFDNLELGSGIRDYALTAALRDSRFKPVELREVEKLSCTVSLLTDFEPCSEPFDWTLENHGIRISFTINNRRYSGTYLPHVATEQGWTKMETLISLARKAGYGGHMDRSLIDQIHVVRYQSQTITFSYQEFLNLKN